MKITTPQLKALYPDEFPRQCTHLKNRCPKCGSGFQQALQCPDCNEKRPRCTNYVMENEDVCRAHTKGRRHSIYNKLAGHLSDTSIAEFLERDPDGRDLTEEFALAKAALAGFFSKGNIPSSQEALEMINTFFDIAQKKKKIEDGSLIKLEWSDELANALRMKFRNLLVNMELVIRKHITQEMLAEGYTADNLIRSIFLDLKQETKTLGNQFSSPLTKAQIEAVSKAQVVDEEDAG